MTVLARPIPKRVAYNGIRPLRGLPANNIRPITIRNWKPPVPEPLPPAPLLGPKELLGLGALVLAQIWGWLSSRPKTRQPAGVDGGGMISGTVPAPGNTTAGRLTITRNGGTFEPILNPDCTGSGGVLSAGNWTVFSQAGITALEYSPVSGSCGAREIRWKITRADGTSSFVTDSSTTYGWLKFGLSYSTSFTEAPSVPYVPNETAIPLPPGYTPPKVEPEVEVDPEQAPKVPVPPPLITPITPVAPPQVVPIPQPDVAPVEPGPSKPPTTDPAKPPVFTPVKPNSPTGIKDGAIVPKPQDPVKVTDPDWHFPIPGGAPITGNGPQAKPEEMAKELGRLEQKLNSLLNPVDTVPEWLPKLAKIYELLTSIFGGTTYTLTEFCNPDQDPDYVPRQWNFDAPGALSYPGVLINRMDALAAMVDQTLRAKQQVCPPIKPQLLGDWVSVNFLSDEPPPDSKSRLKKLFRYRDQSYRPLIDHINHWESFVWEAGPVIVVSKNLSWGTPKVWASTAAEGKRVIQHAADIAGVDLSDPKHQWIVTGSADPRYGRSGRMRVDTRGGEFLRVTSRPGPSGPPIGAVPLS